MGQDTSVEQRYLSSDYLDYNPSWDSEDSPWKARQVYELLRNAGVAPHSIAEVGCGAGGVLVTLRGLMPDAELSGFDIAPAVTRFWSQHESARIKFTLGDFFESGQQTYDLLLALDIVEHLANPFQFLERLRKHARHFVFHFPLDLSAASVLRETPLLYVRAKVGHVHYFTKGLALMLLEECGYRIIESRYTGAAFSAPQQNWKTRLAAIPRRLAYAIGGDFGVRLLGGETLLVLAQSDVSKSV